MAASCDATRTLADYNSREQYVLPEGSVAYLGAVGNDELQQQLRAVNDKVRLPQS